MQQQDRPPSMRVASLTLILISMLLWLVAPFMAVNIATLDNQPSALRILVNDVTLIGDILGTDAFWVACISVIGIVISAICALAKRNGAMRAFLIITCCAMMMDLVFNFAQEYTVWRLIGFGYFAILVLLFIATLVSVERR